MTRTLKDLRAQVKDRLFTLESYAWIKPAAVAVWTFATDSPKTSAVIVIGGPLFTALTWAVVSYLNSLTRWTDKLAEGLP